MKHFIERQNTIIEIEDDTIGILEVDGKEIVRWHVDEWSQDYEVVQSIANAIVLACEDVQALRDLVKVTKISKEYKL